MLLSDILDCNGLSIDLLKSYSFKSNLGLSLKHSLRHFDKEALLEELFTYADWLDSLDIVSQVSLDFRVKAYESIEGKYNRYYTNPKSQARKVFNDILGFRALCDSYDPLLNDQLKGFVLLICHKGKQTMTDIEVFTLITNLTTFIILLKFSTTHIMIDN